MSQVLRIGDVMSRTGLSRSTLYQMMSEQKFPNSFSLGPRSIGWLAEDVAAWIAARAKDGRRIYRAPACP